MSDTPDEPGQQRGSSKLQPDTGDRISRDPNQLDNSIFLGLAVKLNLLTAAQIDATVVAITENPELSVSEWCQAEGFITKADCELVASIAYNLNDDQSQAQESFHELSIDSQRVVSESWRQLNAGVLKSLETLREPDDATHTFQGNQSDKGRFQILRPLAKGGLGELFIAKDTELNREVALKTIKKWNEHDPTSQERFMLEAEITAKLEHPGIVPVYGFGYDENDCPFYAMRYVVGRTLKDQLQRFHERDEPVLAGDRAIEFRKYLRSFIDVCQAVSYGHSRGVLHRDLKPSNIVVGRFDQTFVVDWGLAKAAGHTDVPSKHAEPAIVPSSGSSASVTVDGQALGTPAFMSPEQAAGRNDNLDRRTDVYCLGATLYFLLTGETPFTTGSDILQRIQLGDFKSPLKLNSALPAALVSVCLKAMALAPEDRYQTTEELANDLDRWLADEPVSAFPDRQVDRWRRAYRRNPRFYHLAASTLLIAMLGSISAALLLGQKNVQLAEFSQQIVDERDAAVMNYETARDLAFQLLVVEERELSTVPGKVSIRVDLARQVNAAMKYFYEQSPDNLDVQNSYAQTSRVLANLFRITGHFDEANECFDIAEQLLESVISAGGEKAGRAQLELSHTLIDEASGNVTEGKIQSAIKALERSREIGAKLIEDDPGNVKVMRIVARINSELASCYFERAENDESMKSAELASQGFANVLKTSKLFQDVALQIGSLHAQAQVHVDRGELDQAIKLAEQAVELASTQQSDHPTNDQMNFLLLSRRKLQEYRIENNEDTADIGAELIEVRRGYETLVRDYAGFSIYKRHLARSLLAEARWSVSQGDTKSGIELAEKAAEIVAPKAAKLTVATYRSILADAYALRASLLLADERPALAKEFAAKAIKVQKKLSSDYAESSRQRKRLKEMSAQLADVLKIKTDPVPN